jgi:alkanesulfonate monooxygenase SsuD/methylene tetrahydromethanopterin reductase-like flavin-dependent oxidoreductase (luciferase family)
VPPDVAVTALGEACTIIRRLWDSDQPFDFAGSSYRLTGAVCEPKPVQRPHPPILIGASGNRALRVVAQHADIWDCPTWHGTEELRRRGAVLDRHCADIGRDPTEIVRSAQVFVRGAGPVAIRDELLALIEAGARQLVLSLLPPTPSVAWLAEQIVAPVLAARIG